MFLAVVVAGALVGVSGFQARVRQLEAWASISHEPILGVSATGFRGAPVIEVSTGEKQWAMRQLISCSAVLSQYTP